MSNIGGKAWLALAEAEAGGGDDICCCNGGSTTDALLVGGEVDDGGDGSRLLIAFALAGDRGLEIAGISGRIGGRLILLKDSPLSNEFSVESETEPAYACCELMLGRSLTPLPESALA